MKNEIRVLHILHSMNRGGAETMIMNYYRNIDRTKVQFDFLLTYQEESDYEEEIRSLGGKIYHVTPLTKKTIRQYLKEIECFLKEHKEYKIVHSHTSSKSVFPLQIAKKCGIPVRISHSHNSFMTKNAFEGKELLRKLLRMPLKRVSNYQFACSKDAAIWLYGRKYWEKGKVTILNNAIESQQFIFSEEVRMRYQKEFHIENKFVVGHVGRFNTQKNHLFLLDIFKEIYNKNQNSVLVLVGDGILKKEIEEKIKQLEIQDHVIFTGVRDDIPELLQMMDVFLFPSLYEGLGIVLIEAQAAGLLSFTSDKVVPKEAKVTDLLQYISLEQSAIQWADCVLEKYGEGYQRRDMAVSIQEGGYDIVENAKWLEDFYIRQ